ncbi:hypothetical protein [Pseudomonas sp. TE50-2]|uniref:hypothetical protein n=1 Tax=Pseudomonas sp. TE50-2 TaxID=3142707 RepID=UPI0034677EF5
MDYPKRIPNVGLVGGKFVDENVSTGLPGSLIPSAWGNAVTDELLAVIKAAGLTPSEDDNAQLLQAIQGLAASDVKRAVRVATTGPIALSGLQSIDGVALAAGDRVLVKDQANASQNWIYNAAGGAWGRALDANDNAECTPGHLIIVQAGATYAGSMWQMTNTTPPQVGTTALIFVQLFGKTGVVAGSYRQVTVDALGRVTGGSNPTTLGDYGITDAYNRQQVDAALVQKAPLASPAFTGVPTAVTATKGTKTTQLATTEFVQNEVVSRLLVGAVSRQQPVLASPVNGSDYSAGATLIREAGEIGVSNPVEVRDDYAPAIGFSWQGKASGKLSMDYTGALKWNGSPLLSSAALMAYGIGGQATSTETDLNKYKTGGKFITPASGLAGLPQGWAQGRHVIDVSGGDAYCEQTLNGIGANNGRKAWRVWDGSAWSGWFDAFSYQLEATLTDMVNKSSYNTYVSPRRFADVAFGMNQSPQDMTANRNWGVNYPNTTNKTIWVSVHVRDPGGGNLSASLHINGSSWAKAFMTGGSETTLEGPVPPGGTAGMFREDGNDLIMKWSEYR